MFGQTASGEIYDVPVQTDLSNVVSFLELKFGITHRLGSSPARAGEDPSSVLTGAYGFPAIYFAEKTVKSACRVVGSTLMSVGCEVSQFTALLEKIRRFESGGSESLPLSPVQIMRERTPGWNVRRCDDNNVFV